jgi:hypothetical protein
LDVWSENIAGEEVPKFIYGFPVDGKLTEYGGLLITVNGFVGTVNDVPV